MSSNSAKPANYDWAKDIPCKNITIYGYCKHEDKCAFKHEQATTQQAASNSTNGTVTPASKVASVPVFTPTVGTPTPVQEQSLHNSEQQKKKFNFDSPSFTPTAAAVKSSPRVASTPMFIPESLQQTQQSLQKFNIDTPSFSPGAPPTSNTTGPPNVPEPYFANSPQQMSISQHTSVMAAGVVPGGGPVPVPVHGTAGTPQYPLQYHLYAQQAPPHFKLPLSPYERDLSNLFISNSLREQLQRKNEASNQILAHSNLPDHVNGYHSLVPIDNHFDSEPSKIFGLNTSVFKVQSSTDGNLYCLRKITLVEQIDERAILSVKKWAKVACNNVVKLHEAFTSMSFNDNSLFLVYDYHPCSTTLLEEHFQNHLGKNLRVITEPLLWSYLLQLTNAITAVHSKDLCVREWSLSKLILTGEARLKVSSCGIWDILENSTPADVESLKLRDFEKLGELIFQLSSTMSSPIRNQQLSRKEMIAILSVSEPLKDVLKLLTEPKGASDLMLKSLQEMLAPKMFKQMDGLLNQVEYTEAALSRELENGRLFRLLTKLNFICERAFFLNDNSWSSTGERYPIKLFRDYVFHQNDEMGKPVLDLTHVISCLNKLDCGIDERLLLVSDDEKSCLIMSYKELKELVESSFRELRL